MRSGSRLPLRIRDFALRLGWSFQCAWEGIRYIGRTQPNWWVQVAAAILAVALGVLLQVPPAELAVLALAIGLVLALEAMNTSIERALDATGGPPSPAGKHAKDAAAAAVLVAALASLVVGALVFAPRLLALMARGEPPR